MVSVIEGFHCSHVHVHSLFKCTCTFTSAYLHVHCSHVHAVHILFIFSIFLLFQSSKNDLNLIRERILYLLGSLGGVVNVALLERASSGSTLNQVVSWDSCNKLEFPVPFSDLKPSIYIGRFEIHWNLSNQTPL